MFPGVAAEPATDTSRQLPRGRHGLTRGAVVAHQRDRLVRSVPTAVCAKGYLALTVEDICAEAGVSRRTFYENFRDKEDCFITSYRHYSDELITAVDAASSVGDSQVTLFFGDARSANTRMIANRKTPSAGSQNSGRRPRLSGADSASEDLGVGSMVIPNSIPDAEFPALRRSGAACGG